MVMLLVLSGRRTESRLEMRKTSNNTQHGDQRLCPLGVTESSGLLLYNRTHFAQPHQSFPVLNLSSMNLPTHLNPSWVEAIALTGFAETPCPCSFDQNPNPAGAQVEKAAIRRFTEYYRSATKKSRRSHGPTDTRSHHGTDSDWH